MVCSELVAPDPWNASLQRPNHHTGWGQSLLIIAVCAWNEERPSLLSLSLSEISTSLTIHFWAWIIFLSWKQIPTRITPHTGGQEKFSIRKEKMPWESQKGIKAQETQMLGGMPKSLEKVTSKIKWVCPSKAIKKKEAANQRRATKRKYK